jgi:hypothetical protein
MWDTPAAFSTIPVVSEDVNRKHEDCNMMDGGLQHSGRDNNMMDEDNNMMEKNYNTAEYEDNRWLE